MVGSVVGCGSALLWVSGGCGSAWVMGCGGCFSISALSSLQTQMPSLLSLPSLVVVFGCDGCGFWLCPELKRGCGSWLGPLWVVGRRGCGSVVVVDRRGCGLWVVDWRGCGLWVVDRRGWVVVVDRRVWVVVVVCSGRVWVSNRLR